MAFTPVAVFSSKKQLSVAGGVTSEVLMASSLRLGSRLLACSSTTAVPRSVGTCVRPVIGQVQMRQRHVSIPDFSDYKRDQQPGVQGDESRRAFTYALAAGGGVIGAYTAKNMVQDFLATMSASADVLALAKLEVDVTAIPVGKSVTMKWRGKPLFIRHRTAEEVAVEKSVPVSSLRDPQEDSERTVKEEWLVVLGICTHLGCVPIANAGEYNGYFCPCHGSHYDASGRIRKGPAPLNLEVPPYQFVEDDTKLVVG